MLNSLPKFLFGKNLRIHKYINNSYFTLRFGLRGGADF